MKVFLAPNAYLPAEWRDAARVPSHVLHGDLAAVAPSKANVFEMLTARGCSQEEAQIIWNETRMQRRPFFAPFRQLIEVGAVDPEVPAVYVWYGGHHGDPILRLELTRESGVFGELAVIAHMESTRDGMIAVPAT